MHLAPMLRPEHKAQEDQPTPPSAFLATILAVKVSTSLAFFSVEHNKQEVYVLSCQYASRLEVKASS